MVARILFNPTVGLKVSRPTYDVNTAPIAQVAFDSHGDPYAGVFLAGQSDSTTGGWTTETVYCSIFGAVSFTRLRKTITFSKTFSAPPQVIWTLRDVHNPSSGDYAKYGYSSASAATGTITCNGVVAWASCTTTDVTLRIDYTPSYGGNKDWIFSYMVFQT